MRLPARNLYSPSPSPARLPPPPRRRRRRLFRVSRDFSGRRNFISQLSRAHVRCNSLSSPFNSRRNALGTSRGRGKAGKGTSSGKQWTEKIGCMKYLLFVRGLDTRLIRLRRGWSRRVHPSNAFESAFFTIEQQQHSVRGRRVASYLFRRPFGSITERDYVLWAKVKRVRSLPFPWKRKKKVLRNLGETRSWKWWLWVCHFLSNWLLF